MGNTQFGFDFGGVEYSPEEVSSFILKKIVIDAEQSVGEKIKNVVITCPAYFDSNQREATAKAGEIAGLNVVSVISEPTAAAIAFGLLNEEKSVVLVYDLGGGTFDISMIEVQPNLIKVAVTGGNHHLGGRNWDETILNYLVEKWQEITKSAEDPMDDAETLQDLWAKAEKAKKDLSTMKKVKLRVLHSGMKADIELTREKFAELTANLLAETLMHTRMLLEVAKEKGYEKFDHFILVGGSSKMPQVAAMLEHEFGVQPKMVDPDEIVAKGAALYGQILDNNQQIGDIINGFVDENSTPTEKEEKAFQVLSDKTGKSITDLKKMAIEVVDVTSRSFGIEAKVNAENKVCNLVLVNDNLPVNVTQMFATADVNQRVASIRVMQNLVREPYAGLDASTEIGIAQLTLPSDLPKGAPIEITLQLDGQGRLQVFGKELTSGLSVEAKFDTKNVISEKGVAEAIARSEMLTFS
jgi:molecular chaperone DnaK